MANPAPSDPIQALISALSQTLAQPQPLPPSQPKDPKSWKDGAATAPDPVLAACVAVLMNVLYGASSDMKSVGAGMTDALTEVATVVIALADQISQWSSSAQVDMNLLQTIFSDEINKLPSAVSIPVLNSGNTLSSQLQGLLASPDPADAAIALYSLAQQLNKIAQEIKPQ
jgi:hypothetical protein